MPALPLILLVIATIACIGAMGYLFTRTEPLSPLLKGAAEHEARFQAYVKRELHKAQVGAVNADQWAKDLITHWEKRHG